MSKNTPEHIREHIRIKYMRNSMMIYRKIIGYIPIMLITNISTMFLVSVDGVVVGNLVGSDALSSVSIFFPAGVVNGIISVFVSSGIGTCLSIGMGKDEQEYMERIKAASMWMAGIGFILVSLIQIPVVFFIIKSYHLSPEMHRLTWAYAIGMMFCYPFGLISSIGIYQLSVIGKMDVLMKLCLIEGVVNLILDLLFVGPLHMGVAGAGYGTACANVVRCSLTVLYIATQTDIYVFPLKKIRFEDIREILVKGSPEGTYYLMNCFQNYYIMKIILMTLGEQGGIVKAVCSFSVNLAVILIKSSKDSMRPLMGIFSGSEDRVALRDLVNFSISNILVLTGTYTIFCELFPGILYRLNGVKDIPPGGLFMLRLFALYFIFKGINSIFLTCHTNQNESKFSSTLTTAGNATLPVFAFIMSRIPPGYLLFLSYLCTELLITVFNTLYYRKKLKEGLNEARNDPELFYLSIKPDEATEAARKIIKYAKAIGFDRTTSYRIGLCVEEMVAYAEKAQSDRKKLIHNKISDWFYSKPFISDLTDFHIQLIIRFSKEKPILTVLDDGKCIALDKNKEHQKLIIDNYTLVKKMAKEVNYQYLLNMNYTVITF